ncbi:hypothetical protein [Methanobrevibacter sp.]|uniref:hypothetical protein n=1 Tax=Methanobrevibacter sp. TaxID=66852 RepID=UPI00388D8A4D
MRRKKDDKRVLRRGNGRDTKKHRRPTNIIKRNNNNGPRNRNSYRSRNDNWNRNKKPKKRSRKTVLLMILVLVAFIIGAGIGVMLSFDNGNSGENETHVENVTVEMTTHLNETKEVVFDESDAVDFNENQSSEILGAEDNPYYYDDGLGH